MGLSVSTLENALRAWTVAALDDATILSIFGNQSAPRPGTPFVALWLTGIEQPEHDDTQPVATHAITALSQAARTFTVSGDRRLFYVAGQSVVVADSTGNDGTYTIVSATFAGGNTVVAVTEALASAVVDGVLTGARQVHGTRVLTLQVDVMGPNALQLADQIKSRLALESVLSALQAAGLAVYRAEPIRDLTGLLDTAREPRASFLVRFGTESVEHEFVSIIERVRGTFTSLDSAGATVRAEAIDANMRDGPYDPGP